MPATTVEQDFHSSEVILFVAQNRANILILLNYLCISSWVGINNTTSKFDKHSNNLDEENNNNKSP